LLNNVMYKWEGPVGGDMSASGLVDTRLEHFI